MLHAVRRRALAVACVVLAVSVLAVALGALRSPEHDAEALVQLRERAGAGEPSRAWLYGVVDDVSSEEVSRAAMDRAGVGGEVEEFERRLDLEPAGAGDLRVGYSDSSPEDAAAGADAYASAFVERAGELGEGRLAGGTLGVEAEVAREATVPSVAPVPRTLLYGLIGLSAGLLAGTGLALALESRDRRWGDVRDAELALGVPVLGVIPELDPGPREGRGSP